MLTVLLVVSLPTGCGRLCHGGQSLAALILQTEPHHTLAVIMVSDAVRMAEARPGHMAVARRTLVHPRHLALLASVQGRVVEEGALGAGPLRAVGDVAGGGRGGRGGLGGRAGRVERGVGG